MSIITYYINCAKQSGASFSVVMFDKLLLNLLLLCSTNHTMPLKTNVCYNWVVILL